MPAEQGRATWPWRASLAGPELAPTWNRANLLLPAKSGDVTIRIPVALPPGTSRLAVTLLRDGAEHSPPWDWRPLTTAARPRALGAPLSRARPTGTGRSFDCSREVANNGSVAFDWAALRTRPSPPSGAEEQAAAADAADGFVARAEPAAETAQAAVAASILRETSAGIELLFIERAERRGDPGPDTWRSRAVAGTVAIDCSTGNRRPRDP